MTARNSKLLVIALLISVGLNLAIAGFIGAQWFAHGGPPGRQLGLTFDRHAAFAVLDENSREKINTIWRKRRSAMRSNFKEYRQSKRQLSALLTAENLDKEAVKETHREMMADRNRIENVLNATLLETAEILPPEERAEFFKNGFQRWKSRHRRGGDYRQHQNWNKTLRHD